MMRTVNSHLLEDKMDEAVTHYINSHQTSDAVHVDNSLVLHEETDRVVTVMHNQGYSQMSRQGGEHVIHTWSDEILDSDARLDALVAQIARHSSSEHHHHHHHHHKVPPVRSDVDTSVILDAPLRMFNGQMDASQHSLVVEVPALPPLPPLQEMKRGSTDWFSVKTKTGLKDDTILSEDSQVLDLPGASPAQKHSKKSLPHKKRISRKLKRNNGGSTPQQDLVVINCSEEVPQEEILPDSFVTAVQHTGHINEDTHHITHSVRQILICQICGEYYGEDQLKFYHHLKQHYEPHTTIIIENPVPELGIDKVTNTCIVDNGATLPDSLVELSLENEPKTMYQPIDKHILYQHDKPMYTNKVQYSIANIDKDTVVPTSEAEKADLYDTLDKLELYSCTKCNKSFRKQKQCEAHIKEAHCSNKQIEEMNEFSDPEDLMEGIHVIVSEEYPPGLSLTVDQGTVTQANRHWYMRHTDAATSSSVTEPYCEPCPDTSQDPHHLKEEVFQRIFEQEVHQEANYQNTILSDPPELPEQPQQPEPDTEREVKTIKEEKKKNKEFHCKQCDRVFYHRNSLLYHLLSHSSKQQVCKECGKEFYTLGALKVHKRLHNGDRPYKCQDCGRDFRQWSDLKYHRVSLHSDQKHFKCEFCGKEFARKYSLNVHRRIHTGEKNYKCEYCNKTFRASSYRLSHMRTHTGDRPYKCNECSKAFRVAGDLRRHMLIHEKVRNRFEELKKEPIKPQKKTATPEKKKKQTTDTVQNTEVTNEKIIEEVIIEDDRKYKKVTVTGTVRPPLLKQVDHKKGKKSNLKRAGDPNVTISKDLHVARDAIVSKNLTLSKDAIVSKDATVSKNATVSKVSILSKDVNKDSQLKMNTQYNELFQSRQDFDKYNDVYHYDEFNKHESYKVEVYEEQIVNNFENNERITDERELAILKPIFNKNSSTENEKQVYEYRAENTDGKMQVFTHVERKDYSGPIVTNPVSISERERDILHGENIENGFLDKLTAFYNIPAV